MKNSDIYRSKNDFSKISYIDQYSISYIGQYMSFNIDRYMVTYSGNLMTLERSDIYHQLGLEFHLHSHGFRNAISFKISLTDRPR